MVFRGEAWQRLRTAGSAALSYPATTVRNNVIDPGPHYFSNMDPHPDPNPHPQQIKIRIRINKNQDPGLHQSDKLDPNRIRLNLQMTSQNLRKEYEPI